MGPEESFDHVHDRWRAILTPYVDCMFSLEQSIHASSFGEFWIDKTPLKKNQDDTTW